MKPTKLVFAYPGKYYGMPIYKDENGLLCLENGCFVFRRDCIKADAFKAARG